MYLWLSSSLTLNWDRRDAYGFFYLNLITFWFIIQLNLGITMPYNCCKGIPRLHHSSTHNGPNEALPHFTIALHTLARIPPPI